MVARALFATFVVALAPAGTGQGGGPAASESPAASGGSISNASAEVLVSPVRVARSASGRMFVTDHETRRVHLLVSKNLHVLHSFEIEGKPLGLAATKNDVYVGNETTKKVQVFDHQGQWLFDLGGDEGVFEQPNDIAIDESFCLVFVVDTTAGIVKVFDLAADPTGVFVRTIPPGGPDPSLLAHPTGIAVDPIRGEVLVSDFGPQTFSSAHVRIFDYSGNPVGSISGDWPPGDGFSRPQGLVVDGDHIFLADSWRGQILVYDRISGAQLGTVGTYGTGPGQLTLPLDVEIMPKTKDLIVTNNRLGRLELFKKGGLLP